METMKVILNLMREFDCYIITCDLTITHHRHWVSLFQPTTIVIANVQSPPLFVPKEISNACLSVLGNGLRHHTLTQFDFFTEFDF